MKLCSPSRRRLGLAFTFLFQLVLDITPAPARRVQSNAQASVTISNAVAIKEGTLLPPSKGAAEALPPRRVRRACDGGPERKPGTCDIILIEML